MKSGLLILSFMFSFVVIPGKTFAMDPSVFLKALNVDIENLRSGSGDFVQVRKILGASKQIDKGDGAEYVGHVEYILRNSDQMITFNATECTTGYIVERAGVKKRRGKSVMKPTVPRIEIGGLYLGMGKMEVEKVFAGVVSGGWKVEENKRDPTTQSIVYRKTVLSRDGEKFCDRIWIDLQFDKNGKLVEYAIQAGGCDDSACEDK